MAFDISTFTRVINSVNSFTDRLILIDLDQIQGETSLAAGITGWEAVIMNIAMEVIMSSLNPQGFATSPYVIVDYIMSKLLQPYETDLFFYRFRMNPEKLDHTHKKLQTLTLYGHGAYDLEYFGDDFQDRVISGNTGYCFPPSPLPQIGITDVRLSLPWLSLEHLKRFYLNSSQKLLICFWSEGHLGYLEDLKWSQDAYNPRKLTYSMTFKLHPYFRFNLFHLDVSNAYKYGKVFWNKILRQSDVVSEYTNSSVVTFQSVLAGGG